MNIIGFIAILITAFVIHQIIKGIIRDKKRTKVYALEKSYPNAFKKYVKDNKISKIYELNNQELNTILDIPIHYWQNEERNIKIV